MTINDWSAVDDETLAGHFLLAGIDRRFADQRTLAAELEKRKLLRAGVQALIEKRMKARAAGPGLPGPILAGPGD